MAVAPAPTAPSVDRTRPQPATTSVGAVSISGGGSPTAVRRFTVRCFDLVVATLALVGFAPFLVVVAALVKATSRGPVFYGSWRIGRHGDFRAWKFRSMHVDADERLADLLAADPALATEYALYRKLERDPRMTGFGRLLRRSSLDELPQLVNVIAGQMSVVGPRPKLPNERAHYGDALAVVLQVKPGLTGLWQVSGRSRVPLDERVALDLRYVERPTLRGDLAICARTVVQLLRPDRNGAR